jgi:hypothetical protein
VRSLVDVDRFIKAAVGELSTIECRHNELVDEIGRLRLERASLSESDAASPCPLLDVPITERSPQEAKIALFRSLFRGRDDAHARRGQTLDRLLEPGNRCGIGLHAS